MPVSITINGAKYPDYLISKHLRTFLDSILPSQNAFAYLKLTMYKSLLLVHGITLYLHSSKITITVQKDN